MRTFSDTQQMRVNAISQGLSGGNGLIDHPYILCGILGFLMILFIALQWSRAQTKKPKS